MSSITERLFIAAKLASINLREGDILGKNLRTIYLRREALKTMIAETMLGENKNWPGGKAVSSLESQYEDTKSKQN